MTRLVHFPWDLNKISITEFTPDSLQSIELLLEPNYF